MSTAFDELFKRYGQEYGVDWQLLKAQVAAESNFDPHAISDAGAQGLAQFMPDTFHEWAQKLGIAHPDPFVPEQAIHAQAGYLAWLIHKTGDTLKALAAYNWGISHIRHLLDDPDWLEKIPDETRAYVERINKSLSA